MNDDLTFFDKVYLVVKQIPFGRVTSYGAIAAFLGTKGSARMVGWAMNASHNYIENIPEITKLILCDAQTSGGLLIAIPEAFGAGFIRKLNENHNKQAEIIGKIIETDETSTGIIQVINLK